MLRSEMLCYWILRAIKIFFKKKKKEPSVMMKNQCQNVPDAVLIAGPEHFHPPDKRKHLSCHNTCYTSLVPNTFKNESSEKYLLSH